MEPLRRDLKKVAKQIFRRLEGLPVTHLNNDDFKTGTYQITKPGRYVLTEDIIFEPNRETNYRPDPADPRYQSRAYSLGFFAGITLECPDIYLDLNGFEIRQSIGFAVAQRFFACIETASCPFLPGQGPGNFGPSVVATQNCIICNGTIGRSSHHGIHGNNSSRIILMDLVFRHFEVAAVALNGGSYLFYKNIQIGPNSQEIPVLGTYSAAVFDLTFYPRFEPYLEFYPGRADLLAKRNKLAAAVDQVQADIETTGQTTHPVFANVSGLLDGNGYGILIHPPGVAVDDFTDNDFKGKMSQNIYMKNIRIHGLHVNVTEVIGLSMPDGTGSQTSPSGSVFRIQDVTDEAGHYRGNVLTDFQLAMAEALTYIQPYMTNKNAWGKLSITPQVIAWSKDPTKTIQNILNQEKFAYKCGGDTMSHLNKGIVGFRFDGVDGMLIQDLYVDDIMNMGTLGNDVLFQGPANRQDTQERLGYHGGDAIGINFSRVLHVQAKNINLRRIAAHNGEASGVRFINGCQHGQFDYLRVTDCQAGHQIDGEWRGRSQTGEWVEYTDQKPNRIPRSIGVHLDDHHADIVFTNRRVDQLKGPGEVVSYFEK